MTVTVEHILSATWKKQTCKTQKHSVFVLESYDGVFLIIDVSDSTAILSQHCIYYDTYSLQKTTALFQICTSTEGRHPYYPL